MNENAYCYRYVITGPPGTGKTTLITRLKEDGYVCLPECARIVAERSNVDKRSAAFNQAVIREGMRLHESVNGCPVSFFDRGVPDTIAYARLTGDPNLAHYEQIVREVRYDGVFMLPLWPEIYATDDTRDEDLEEAQRIEDALCAAYREAGYEL